MRTNGIGALLLTTGVILVLIGMVWMMQDKIPFVKHLGRLPGDMRIEKESFNFYFPVATCLLISAVLSLIYWLFRR